MMIRTGLTLLALLLLVPALAFADEEPAFDGEPPYTPMKFSPSDLIIGDRFNVVPLAFPWEEISSDREANQGRMDFVLTYDIPFSEVREFLPDAYRNTEDFIELRSDALKYTDVGFMRIAGIELGDTEARITIAHPDMELTFSAHLVADGPRTRVVIPNRVTGRQFSGFVPARVGFRPAGANEIHFRGN